MTDLRYVTVGYELSWQVEDYLGVFYNVNQTSHGIMTDELTPIKVRRFQA